MKVQFVQEVDGWIWDGKQETVDEINKHDKIKTIGKLRTVDELLVIKGSYGEYGKTYIGKNNWIIFHNDGDIDIFPVSEFVALGYRKAI